MIKQLVSFFLLLPTLLWAAPFTEGKDYQIVPQINTTLQLKPPAVVEFFSYGCPWCYQIEPNLLTWKASLGDKTQFQRIPVVFKPDWEIYAKAYYTAKILALSEKVNPKLFKAIQEEKQPLSSNQAMIQFFVTQGVDKEIVTSAFENSPTIDMNVKNGLYLMSQYQINAVPAFVINNKYKTNLELAGSPERLFEIMNYLLKKS